MSQLVTIELKKITEIRKALQIILHSLQRLNLDLRGSDLNKLQTIENELERIDKLLPERHK